MQAFSLNFYSMRENFEGPSFVRKCLEPDTEFYICLNMVLSTTGLSNANKVRRPCVEFIEANEHAVIVNILMKCAV